MKLSLDYAVTEVAEESEGEWEIRKEPRKKRKEPIAHLEVANSCGRISDSFPPVFWSQ